MPHGTPDDASGGPVDAELVRAFRDTGDPESFSKLVGRYKSRVFRLAVSILGPGREADAEDVAQDVFIKVYQKLHQFRGDSKFGSWIYRIAYRQTLDHLTRPHRRMPHVTDSVLETQPSNAPEANPLDRAMDARTRHAVQSSMGELPHLYRSVLHLHYWLGLTVAEISDTLGTPEGTVKSYMHRGRAKLDRLLRRRGIANV